MSIRVPDIRTDLAPVILGLREELGALGRPFGVDLLDVRDTDVEESAGTVGVWWRREGHGGLVVGRAAPDVEDQPGVGDLHDDWVALEKNLPVEERLIEVTGPVLIGDHQEVRENEALFRCRKVLRVHLTLPFFEVRRPLRLCRLLLRSGSRNGAPPRSHQAAPGPRVRRVTARAAAEARGLVVLHYDADFDRIAAVTRQTCQWSVPAGSIS